MKQLIRLSLILIVAQVISSELIIKIHRNEVYDFHPMAVEFRRKLLKVDVTTRIKEFEMFIEFLETQTLSPSAKNAARQALTEYVESYKPFLPFIELNDIDCREDQNLPKIPRDYVSDIKYNMDYEQRTRWSQYYFDRKDQGRQLLNEFRKWLPEAIEKFLSSLDGSEREIYEAHFNDAYNSYGVFLTYYRSKEDIKTEEEEDICDGYQHKIFMDFLEMCSEFSQIY